MSIPHTPEVTRLTVLTTALHTAEIIHIEYSDTLSLPTGRPTKDSKRNNFHAISYYVRRKGGGGEHKIVKKYTHFKNAAFIAK